MDITFFDGTSATFNADTPFFQPLGGSQSAMCYLAAALVELGHHVSLVNRTAHPGVYNGVRSLGLSDEAYDGLRASDVVIIQNGATGQYFRQHHRVKCPLILWSGHAHDQAAVERLHDPQERAAWNGIAVPSQWALTNYVRHFGLRAERCRALYNGIAPGFALAEPGRPWFENSAPPVLAYTSTPYRGLEVLLEAFPAIRAAIPGTQLLVYSGMGGYGANANDAQYSALYERCRQTAGVKYVGPIAQAQLAQEISGIAALAYPSTFAETFCISAAEAMSLGALLLTTKLGALPELYSPFAFMIEPGSDFHQLATAYSAHVIEVLTACRRDPAGAAAHRANQIAFIKSKYTWPTIALQWAAWLQEIAGRSEAGV